MTRCVGDGADFVSAPGRDSNDVFEEAEQGGNRQRVWRCRDIPSLVAVLWATSEEVPLSAMERHFCEAWSVVPLGVSPVVLHGVAWWENDKGLE